MNKLLIVGVIATTALLGGCSNTDLEKKVNVLSNQVSELSTSVNALAADHEMMKTDTAATAAAAQAAATEAERANARLDNMVQSYQK